MKQTLNYNFPILEAGDKYIKDYHNLEKEFREEIVQIRERMDNMMSEKS